MKTTLKTATQRKRNSHDNGSVHITTLDFGRLRPTYCLNVRRGDNIKMDYSQFTRLAPLVAPTFGSAKIRSYAFWVPLRTIWPSYKAFIDNSVDASLSIKKKPQNVAFGDVMGAYVFKNSANTTHNWQGVFSLNDDDFDALSFEGSDIWDEWINDNFIRSLEVENPSVASDLGDIVDSLLQRFDQVFYDEVSLRIVAVNFTPLAIEFQNTLMSLGYPYWRAVNVGSASDYFVNITPLVAYFRCLYDFVFPSEYVAQLGVDYLFDDYDFQQISDIGTLAAVQLWLDDAIKLLYTPYEQDFFNTLWHSANQVAAGNGATSDVGVESNDFDIFTALNRDENNRALLTNNKLQWIMNASDFIMRNNIGGTRFHEFIKAHTGWQSSMDTIERSMFLKGWTDSINVMDVTQTSQTSETSALGEQAGKGISSGKGTLRFESKEDGFIIVLSMVTPVTAYYQGTAPWCEMLDDRFSLYTEEFDSVGMEAVPRSSVWCDPQKYEEAENLNPNAVFGFTSRYANRYKRRFDRLTGMFRFRGYNTGLDSYHTFRNVMYGRTAETFGNDAKFRQVDNQYDRIFALTTGEQLTPPIAYERFLTIFNFDVERWNTMKSISAAMPLFDKSGENVSVDYQGTQI